jgi:hypothetical protein
MIETRPLFTTRVTMTVEVSHWGVADPASIVSMLQGSLNYPAVQHICIDKVESNHTNHDGPLTTLVEV